MLVPLRSGEIDIYLSGEDMEPLVIYGFFKTNFVIGGAWTARSIYIFMRKCLNTILL